MNDNTTLDILVFPGDGIGPEVMAPALDLLDAVVAAVEPGALAIETMAGGAAHYAETGSALPDDAYTRAREVDAILLGAMGDPRIRYPDGREIAPQVDIREELGLFAGVRPVFTAPGMPVPLADPRGSELDFVIIRESTEGFFAGRHTADVTADRARETSEITRAGSERLFTFAFDLARKRQAAGGPGIVTCVDKANIFRSFKFFREVFEEVAARYPDIEPRTMYVDAAAMQLVKQPWQFDVIVTENLFGDILSDLGAGLMGGLGMAPSADIGHDHAVFQPCHGTAPDIAGSGKANPTAMILSVAMMLEWLGERHERPALAAGGAAVRAAVAGAFGGGALHPFELGGGDGLAEIAGAVSGRLDEALTAGGSAGG
jgi:3-isopropylmalate dehydrogenase